MASAVSETIPNACPGTQSQSAGKNSACQGCPNQKICSSGQANIPDPAIGEIKERLSSVKHKLLVLSGKGGVGKSTFSAQLTYALAQDMTKQVAVLDVDICGPSIPLLMGVEGQQIHQSSSGWSPVAVEENIGVMSVGFMLEGPDAAVIWRGPKKTGMIKKFLCEVDWGDLDYLVIDTPPGTSDEHLAIVQYLNGAQIDGAIIVTTPQEVSLVDVRKEINFCKKVGIPLVGIVENMSGFVCPNCKKETEIFAPSSGGAEKVASEMSVKFLGRLPLDPRIAKSSDSGQSMISVAPDSPAVIALTAITQEIREYCEAISVARTSMPE